MVISPEVFPGIRGNDSVRSAGQTSYVVWRTDSGKKAVSFVQHRSIGTISVRLKRRKIDGYGQTANRLAAARRLLGYIIDICQR